MISLTEIRALHAEAAALPRDAPIVVEAGKVVALCDRLIEVDATTEKYERRVDAMPMREIEVEGAPA